ncbi:DNA-binding transcriptional regulator, GntR family [Sinosporangium album]|uniref:DNA-binding transcriptional regulator, GntR family n=1 Tax=Sinosporangium album TaxID=504805 RepID=A0A1G8IJ66_9ACTN|nr:GntR family transcriptional regulator [Sinosporangium album]SDI18580.1 DNA-binding transcriptional regulator, GntR family [Sinosporangium album]
MARQGGATTRTEGIYRRLRADILGGRLTPGERLKFPDLCGNYNTSVGAAREALARLSAEGLVRAQAHQGYMVRPLSHDDLLDLTEARIEVETLVFRMSVTHGNVRWEADLVAAHHVLERTPFPDGEPAHVSLVETWAVAHTVFHRALFAGCPNRRLTETARALREEAELYRHWSLPAARAADRDHAGEHRALLDAALDRDADRAADLLRAHIAHTTDLLIGVRGVPA